MKHDLHDERAALRARCRWISGHGPSTPAAVLAAAAEWCRERNVQFDQYGSGALIEDFEAQVAERLGYPAARFMPSGTMAQQIALRVWCEHEGRHHVAMHPTCHLELHEQGGYAHLHGLRATLLGPRQAPLLAEHLEASVERFAALVVELPIREAGGQCPSWSDLQALKAAARRTGTRLHLDGARLWECAAGYDRTHAEICQGFDSCYVSFYKGIGALSGAMLLGPREFIDEAAVWQRRCGGNLYTLAPNVASARMLFEERLARMDAYYGRALSLADALHSLEGITVLPHPPHTPMMHAFLPRSADDAASARDRVARQQGLWLFNAARDADLPGHCRVEIHVGEATMELDDAEVRAGFEMLLS